MPSFVWLITNGFVNMLPCACVMNECAVLNHQSMLMSKCRYMLMSVLYHVTMVTIEQIISKVYANKCDHFNWLRWFMMSHTDIEITL